MDYFIKDGYRSNPNPRSVKHSIEKSMKYQRDVYVLAADVARERGLQSVLDVGCGWGAKLCAYLGDLCPDLYGVDLPENIAQCRQMHAIGTWLSVDISDPAADIGRRFDMIMSVDVIEHLLDPDILIRFVAKHAHADTVIILSTPERDLRRGTEDMGPPGNLAHVREWNAAEFNTYLEASGLLRVIDRRVVEREPGARTCQVSICRPVLADRQEGVR